MSEEKKSSEGKKSTFELTVALINAVAWPTVSMIALIAFLGPLRSTMKQLPDLVSRSGSISIGNLSIEVERGLQQKASPEVKEALSRLSAEGIKELLDTTAAYYSEPISGSTQDRYTELLNLGLIQEVPQSKREALNPEYVYAVEITSLGEKTKEFLLAVVEELIQEIDGAEDTEK